jgi:hypothetical protein
MAEACVGDIEAKRRKLIHSITDSDESWDGVESSADESLDEGDHQETDEARIAKTHCEHCQNQRATKKYGGLTTRCCVSCAEQKHPEWHQAKIAETRCEHCRNHRATNTYGGLTTRCCVSCAEQNHPEWHQARIAETRCKHCLNQRATEKYGGLTTRCCIKCAKSNDQDWYRALSVSRQCKSSHCETWGSRSLDGFCAPCFRNAFPLDKRARWSRSKEVAVVKFLSERFPDVDWSFNKTISGGTFRRRPDAFAKLPDRALSIEVDEFSHVGYECICESRKVMEHFEDAGRVPHLFVRFNPDGYLGSDGVKVPSCWAKTPKTQEPRVAPKQVVQWKHRLEKLAQILQHFCENKPDREVFVIELFYR